MTTYGTLTLGRLALRETFTNEEKGGADRTLRIAGQESQPPLAASDLLARHDGILGLAPDIVLPVVWTDKPGATGYYTATEAESNLTERQGEMAVADWKVTLARVGSQSEVDLESRLTGTVRANDFSLTGERWHAPPINHFGYFSGSTLPTPMTRASADGVLTVYRAVPTGVSPRWGCPPSSYGLGRVRVLSEGAERTGVNTSVATSGWEISNALVRVRPSGAALEVAAYDGTTWEAKTWNITIGSSAVAAWDAVSILRNDYEQAVVRLASSRSPGRVTLDLTLRRGARFVEGYLQRDDSGTLAVSLASLENTTDFASAGYVVAASADAAGNKYTAGSARNFTLHASGGLTKNTVTAIDFYLGAVVNSATAPSGDAAVDLRNQYIAAMAEFTVGVRR